MTTDDSISAGISSLANKGKSFLVGLGSRLLVHFVAIVAGGIISSTLRGYEASMLTTGSVVFTSYIGIICLFPREMGKTADWLIPTGAGLLHCIAWVALGVPWQYTLIWGGALTWVLRLLRKSGKMGWEWTALPWLLIGLYSFFDGLLPLAAASVPFWTFPLLAGLGWCAQQLHARLRIEPIHRAMLTSSVESIQKQIAARTLPGPLEAPVRQLAEQTAQFARLCRRMDKDAMALARTVSDVASQVTRLTARPSPSQWDSQAGKTFAAVAELNGILSHRLAELAPVAPDKSTPSPDNADTAHLNGFRDSAMQLATKKRQLPTQMHAHIDGICRAIDNILECMRSDPQDFAAGDKFLSRYLKAAHMVADEHIRLAREGAAHESVTQVLARSTELLERLEKAFIDEHGRLLQNDTINFTAELNVLDKLLKMQGR